jgi:PBP1b-binding outer membrane lipoprotein LpoB
MMKKRYQLILLLPFLFIGGCSSGEDTTTPERSSKEHVFSDQTRALEKAKGVEQVIQSGADKQRQAIEEQSQ